MLWAGTYKTLIKSGMTEKLGSKFFLYTNKHTEYALTLRGRIIYLKIFLSIFERKVEGERNIK